MYSSCLTKIRRQAKWSDWLDVSSWPDISMVETMGRFPQSECNNRKAGKAPQLTIQPYNKNNFNMVKVAEQ